MPEKIRVVVNDDGTVSIDLNGFKGRKCKDISNMIASCLGGEIIERREKPEIHQIQVEERGRINI